MPPVGLVADDPDTRVAAHQVSADLGRVVRGAIIDDKDVDVDALLVENALDALFQVSRIVVAGNEDLNRRHVEFLDLSSVARILDDHRPQTRITAVTLLQ